MKVIKNPERMNRRCEKLQKIGLKILHNDSSVGVPIGNGKYFESDFSTIDENKFFEVAIRKAFDKGVDKGEDNIRHRFKQILQI